MPTVDNETLMNHAMSLLDVRDEMRRLEMKAEFHKEVLHRELMTIGQGHVSVRISSEEILDIKNNLRFTKSFDKDTLAGKVGMERTELDYAGVSHLVETRRLTAAEVEKHQAEGRSEFVTVRKKKSKVKSR
jgi:hypothetical protein